MDKNTVRYLNTKEKSQYTDFDLILSFYASGQFCGLLQSCHATQIQFYPSVKHAPKSLQVCFDYYNLHVVMDFRETYCEYCTYLSGCSAEEVERAVKKVLYADAFDLKTFIAERMNETERDARLSKRQTSDQKKAKDKRKVYAVIADLSLLVPLVIVGIMAVYIFWTGRSIQLNASFSIVLIGPIVMWFVFSVLAKK